MSSVENRAKRDEMQLSVLTNDRNTLVNVRRENDHSTLVIVHWANDRPSVRSCALEVHLTRQARWTTSKRIQELLIEVGN
jgi:hypothetical protein